LAGVLFLSARGVGGRFFGGRIGRLVSGGFRLGPVGQQEGDLLHILGGGGEEALPSHPQEAPNFAQRWPKSCLASAKERSTEQQINSCMRISEIISPAGQQKIANFDRTAKQAKYAVKRERYRQATNRYNERMKTRTPGSKLPKRPQPPKPPQ
jgi:hypothetical protein